jgi:hypothetical protein
MSVATDRPPTATLANRPGVRVRVLTWGFLKQGGGLTSPSFCDLTQRAEGAYKSARLRAAAGATSADDQRRREEKRLKLAERERSDMLERQRRGLAAVGPVEVDKTRRAKAFASYDEYVCEW